jgi:adenine-specific DNA methylase
MSHGQKAIEADFPYAEISRVAEAESWRKELNRPLSHIHKWWAQRLGSVFRGILIGAYAPAGGDVWQLFYQRTRFEGVIVYDPFMGSGTTLVEARKLGCRVIGRDINPVAYFLVRNAFGSLSLKAVTETFREIEADTAPAIRRYYETRLADGRPAQVLYYFWVKHLPCPQCDARVDLFDSLQPVNVNAAAVTCPTCQGGFKLKAGTVKGGRATCPACQHPFVLVERLKALKGPPEERMYAKLVLLPNGTKAYLAPTDFDRQLYRKAARDLAGKESWYPVVPIERGYNTDQALRYN